MTPVVHFLRSTIGRTHAQVFADCSVVKIMLQQHEYRQTTLSILYAYRVDSDVREANLEFSNDVIITCRCGAHPRFVPPSVTREC